MDSENSTYALLGGAEGVRDLVTRFYGFMDQLPDVLELRRLHPESLERSADSLFKFFSGWFGGPSLYIAERGHPRLRMRHFPFSIGELERDQWMKCMRLALNEAVVDTKLRSSIEQACASMANHMVNT